MVAKATVDFEPGRGLGNGFELVIPNDVHVDFGPHGGHEDYKTVFVYLDALAQGMRDGLAADHRAITDVIVFLRRVVIHPTDSNERAFRAAGQIAARIALQRAFGPSSGRGPLITQQEPRRPS
jgi:hypothetical protein